jgi:hypothetical protein
VVPFLFIHKLIVTDQQESMAFVFAGPFIMGFVCVTAIAQFDGVVGNCFLVGDWECRERPSILRTA